MASTDKQKQSLYFPDEMLHEIMIEANRLDRSLSWIVQQAWRMARTQVRKFPSSQVRAQGRLDRPAASDEATASIDDIRPSAEVREFLKGKFDSEMAS